MNEGRKDRRWGRSDIPHPGVTPLSPSELLPLREADGPERESRTGYIQRLQIRGSTKNTATGSGERQKETESAGSRRRVGEETKNEVSKKKKKKE